MKDASFPQLDEFLQRLLDDQIQPEEMERLQKALREDSRVRDYYIDSMLACAVNRRSSQVIGDSSHSHLFQAFPERGRQGGFKRLVRRFGSIAAILILGTLIFACVGFFQDMAKGPAIGVLADVYEAQWSGSRPRPGEPIFAGKYHLREGVAKITLDLGTSLLLEAPCRVELTRIDEMTLGNGRLTVQVSPEATGFRVRTHEALITDLGTDFGVVAHTDGRTEAHVLKGRIRVALDPNKAGQPSSMVVNEGQAAAVDADGRTLQGGLMARADLFLLQPPSLSRPLGPLDRLNLADLVGGGNGRNTRTLDRGIDLGTGQMFKHPATRIQRTRQSEFRSTSKCRGIDGIFVPNGALGPVVISSTGLTFSDCPRTVGSYFGGPASSGKFFDLPSQQVYSARLNGIHFGTSRHPALNLHPNAGITFDLDEIRQDHPNLEFDRFTAVCGIPKDLPGLRFSTADVWILLDGTVKLHLRYPKDQNLTKPLDVPIPPQARFLTLVATCSGLADFSWVLFGDPFLEQGQETAAR